MHVGFLFIDHEENNHADLGDLGDMIYGGAKLINWMNSLTSEELSGKVNPSLIMQNHHMKFWDKRIDGEQFLSADQINKRNLEMISIKNPQMNLKSNVISGPRVIYHNYNSDFPEEQIPADMTEEVLQWELSQQAAPNPVSSEINSEPKNKKIP